MSRARRLYALAAGCAAVLGLWYGLRNFEEAIASPPHDMVVDWNGARALRAGYDPYSAEGLRFLALPPSTGLGHPPTTFVWFLPLADLSLAACKAVWNQLVVLLLFLHLLVIVTELELPSPLLTLPLLFGAVLSTSWMCDHFLVAQLSEVIALLYALAWYHLRRGRDGWAGVALGLACTLKFFPAVVILLLLLVGRWRVAPWAAAAWSAFAVPVTAKIGLHAWREFAAQQAPIAARWLVHVRNASVFGMVQRLHYPLCTSRDGLRAPWVPGLWIAAAIVLALIALAWRVTRGAARRGPRAIDLPFALFTALSLISSQWAWEHYYTALLLPLAVAGVALWRARRAGLGRRGLTAGVTALVGCVALLALSIHWKSGIWFRWYTATPPPHYRLHLVEAFADLPTPLALALLASLLVWSERRAPGALDDLRLD
jgi:hypothetical protein